MSRKGLIVMAVLAAGCGMNKSPDRTAEAEPAAIVADASSGSPARGEQVPAMMQVKAAIAPTIGVAGNSAPAAETTARMIVRSAELTLQVADVRKAVAEIADATAGMKGFLGASRLWRDGDSDHATMTIRVPSATLDATIVRLRGMAVRVDNELVTGEDVTRQAVDLNAQLTNLRATEAELRALLTTVRLRTRKASDVLEVHTELSRIRGEIDQHAAELQSLTQLAALSTITLDLRPDVVATPIATDTWRPVGVLRDALRALAGTGRAAVNGVIWAVVYVAPLLLLAAGALIAVRRLWGMGRRQLRAETVN